MAKNALQKIEEHEKLCRIMQKQTHDKIHKLERQINRIESILLVSTGALITGMGYVIFTLIIKRCYSVATSISIKMFKLIKENAIQ